MSDPFIAQIFAFPYTFAPRSYAYCRGGLLPISQNTALFSLIGTIYGGDGRSTLGLPDLNGRVAVGAGNGPGLSPFVEGQRGGQSTHTLTVPEMASHNHSAALIARGPDENTANPNNAYLGDRAVYTSQAGSNEFLGGVGPNGSGNGRSDAIGGSQPHYNMMPYLTLNYFIALQGTYPSRS